MVETYQFKVKACVACHAVSSSSVAVMQPVFAC
jgi:cytochrome c551/c552